jgi:single-strand DNA-binding protein
LLAVAQAGRTRREALTRGTRVIVTGRLKQRSFETQDGDKRSTIEMDVDEIGPSLRYVSVTVHRSERVALPAGVGATAATPWATGPQPNGSAFSVTDHH